ncbi:unnamed protein product [Caenorhabditis brenneri]
MPQFLFIIICIGADEKVVRRRAGFSSPATFEESSPDIEFVKCHCSKPAGLVMLFTSIRKVAAQELQSSDEYGLRMRASALAYHNQFRYCRSNILECQTLCSLLRSPLYVHLPIDICTRLSLVSLNWSDGNMPLLELDEIRRQL